MILAGFLNNFDCSIYRLIVDNSFFIVNNIAVMILIMINETVVKVKICYTKY